MTASERIRAAREALEPKPGLYQVAYKTADGIGRFAVEAMGFADAWDDSAKRLQNMGITGEIRHIRYVREPILNQ